MIATKKGVNILERGSQVHFMAEFQELLDFPPAPKLNVFGKLDPKKATRVGAARPGTVLRQGAVRVCHPAPYYTDNSMHNLQTERFFKPQMINGRMAAADGPIKTFPLRGIKDSPPYLHDGRLLTLEDTVEFFNLILETQAGRRGKEGSGGVLAGAVTKQPTCWAASRRARSRQPLEQFRIRPIDTSPAK